VAKQSVVTLESILQNTVLAEKFPAKYFNPQILGTFTPKNNTRVLWTIKRHYEHFKVI
jgi:hypothetical protein